MATYANIFQQECLYKAFNHHPIFEVIAKNYKQNIKQQPAYQTYLNGLIVAILKNKKFMLHSDPNPVRGSSSNNLAVIQDEQFAKINTLASECSKQDSSDSMASLN